MPTLVVCAACSKTFPVIPSRSNTARYCSRECYGRPFRVRGGPPPSSIRGARWVDLGGGVFSLVDREDHVQVIEWTWATFKVGEYTYAAGGKGGHVLLHRFILEVTDPKVLVDHISWDTLDNRRSNLRLATRSQNLSNGRKFRGVSPYRGVTKNRKGWAASIKAGKRYHLGTYPTQEEAAAVYDTAARKHHGEFARLNFPHKGELGCRA